ncbi:deoxyhypusine synthase family protein [Candidatus Methanodesulfokora washburnensis]|jgi:deoxyhypusine synthase|uniref:Deoxyhypusine synthase n=1 Tax=Candidatus Methanodesulfokora washburnensis TaxID=2478471 RepID=A0A3R9PFC5_9CREN|nr:deoxyhypusine synthase family protein [Candidatus Methanodesulfokores washburnensis]RSN71451.1 deoxyhypusine synthase [Candidatus Methanodesulfokores washburnensis]
MEYVRDLLWRPGLTVKELVEQFSTTGFQSIELYKAAEIMVKMKREGAKVILSFTSNMGTSGLRGLFAQLIRVKMVDIVVTTVGAIEEDIMKAIGEKFYIHRFDTDDIKLHEDGMNRVGNLLISNDSYVRFENYITHVLDEIFRKSPRISVSSLLREIGIRLDDRNSFLYQAALRGVPVLCPAITDGAMGFHLYMARQRNPDAQIDIIEDFSTLLFSLSQEDKKGLIALGGGVSKHHAMLATLLSGGADYAVYITTSHASSGSMSGATTSEAKSWGKIKDDSDSVTVIGDATILFPIAVCYALDVLSKEGIVEGV